MNWLERLRRLVRGDDDASEIVRVAEQLEDPSRRRFLRNALLTTTIAATVDVEQLLWTPRSIVLVDDLPTIAAVSRNAVTPNWISREVAQMFVNNLKIAERFDRAYDESFIIDSRRVRLA